MSNDSSLPNTSCLEPAYRDPDNHERKFVAMACEALCRLADEWTRMGKVTQADEILDFCQRLVSNDSEIELSRSRILEARGQITKSRELQSAVAKNDPWAARLHKIVPKTGSYIRVRNQADAYVVDWYTHYFENSPLGVLKAMAYARSKLAQYDIRQREKECDYEDSASTSVVIERCSEAIQNLGVIDIDESWFATFGIFDSSQSPDAGQELVFGKYHWPYLMNELQNLDAGTASRILLVLQDINRLIEFEANRIDLGPLIDAAKLTGTEETVVLDCLLSFLREKREHRMLINFPKRFRKANFAKSASKIELIQLERRFHEVNRNVAEKVYCSIQEQLEQAGLKSPSEVLKDFEVRAAPIIVKKAYEITKSVAVSQTP